MRTTEITRREQLVGSAAIVAGLSITNFGTVPTYGWDRCEQNVADSELTYFLVAFDSAGNERLWNGKSCIAQVAERLTEERITDVFIFSHGWMGDVTQAKAQYVKWISAMASCKADIARLRQRKQGFRPLIIGVHWPSLPFGDEVLRTGQSVAQVEGEIDAVNALFANTRRSRESLRTILTAAKMPKTDSLSPEVVNAFKSLQLNGPLRSYGAAAPPGLDAEEFDPQKLYQASLADPNVVASAARIGADDWHYNILYLLATVSFWTMKDRARKVGETGVHQMLQTLQQAVPFGRSVNFHLMGHSFGCIVVSSSLLGPKGKTSGVEPVSSLSLVQGAFSHWSYSTKVYDQKVNGFFRPIVDRKLVAGPIITTQSSLDYAVGTLYPYAAGIARQAVMARDGVPSFPKYGAVGAFGIQGEGLTPLDIEVLGVDKPYGFAPSGIYNIECSSVIKKISPLSGAHSDISHPEIAHAVWEAVKVGSATPDETPLPSPRPAPPVPLPDRQPGGLFRRVFRRNR